jgi:hypothetical protein
VFLHTVIPRISIHVHFPTASLPLNTHINPPIQRPASIYSRRFNRYSTINFPSNQPTSSSRRVPDALPLYPRSSPHPATISEESPPSVPETRVSEKGSATVCRGKRISRDERTNDCFRRLGRAFGMRHPLALVVIFNLRCEIRVFALWNFGVGVKVCDVTYVGWMGIWNEGVGGGGEGW